MSNFNKVAKGLAKNEDKEWAEQCREIWTDSRVLIGMPNTGHIEDIEGPSPFKSMLHLAMYFSSQRETIDWSMQTIPRMITHEARNNLARQAIEGGYTHLFMVDSDHTFPADIIHRLLLFKKDIVGVRAYKRTSPHFPCIFAENENIPDKDAMMFVDAADQGLMVADGIGFGAILIKTSVFKDISYPYFYFSKTGEDFNFCKELRKAGYKIYVDTDTEIGHVTSKVVTREDYLRELNNGTIDEYNQKMVQSMQGNGEGVDFSKTNKS